jgi:hypothetical protein
LAELCGGTWWCRTEGRLFPQSAAQSDNGSMLQLIAQAHGLLLLIDPGACADSYWEMFADNIHSS